jgi:hypothetical protein
MQAIQSKYLLPSHSRGSRIKATCERGSITIPYPYELSGDEVHREAVRRLVAQFLQEDQDDGICPDPSQNIWARQFVTGCLPDGSMAHVFIV